MHPASPYAASKIYSYHTIKIYREAYGIFASNGILFNHESPIRGLEFVTRKVTNMVAQIKLGLKDELVVGNIESIRDWGYAEEYVEAMWRILQLDNPDDFVEILNSLDLSDKTPKVNAFEEVDVNKVLNVFLDKYHMNQKLKGINAR